MPVVDARRWTIGELAKASGVSVRALRHYDAIGLLAPAERSSAGYRLYGPEQLERLYRLLALRRLGLPLPKVAAMLEADEPTLQDTLEAHLVEIEEQLDVLDRLRHSASAALRQLQEGEAAQSEELMKTIEGMSMTIQLTRIYTRRGDDGWTALTDGTRVAKSDQRLAPDIEELNAHLGLALSVGGLSERQNAVLAEVQNDLFDVGADLVSPPSESGHSGPLASPAYTQKLEAACDEANAALAPLDSFVVPGGSVLAAQLHVCRTVCRRIERAAAAVDGINPEALRYLNRLSDLLFIFARVAGQYN